MGKTMETSTIFDINILLSSSLLLTHCLFVTDNAKDAVHIHVSASSEEKE
jgi:hypothetical protein